MRYEIRYDSQTEELFIQKTKQKSPGSFRKRRKASEALNQICDLAETLVYESELSKPLTK
jgi:hypothetical protein